MLQISGLNAWYGASHAVQDVAISVAQGELVVIAGRNGAGKTTLLKSVMGLMARTAGIVRFDGQDISRLAPEERYHLGIAYVPEERRIVRGLTVVENLKLGLVAARAKADEREALAYAFSLFPVLETRLSQVGTSLSGGEQQMLAIARALLNRPRLLLLDEPSEGIMPVLVTEMFARLKSLKNAGTTILLVEQNVARALAIANNAYIMDAGRIVYEAPAAALLADARIRDKYCSV